MSYVQDKAEELSTPIVNAMDSYLRKCESGGMSKKAADKVRAAVEQAASLGYFLPAILAYKKGDDSA